MSTIHFPCRHCGLRRGATAFRKLCGPCFREPEILALYPSRNIDSTIARHPGREPAEPTSHARCTAAFELVVIARLEAGENITHPKDAYFDDEGTFHWWENGEWKIDPHAFLIPGEWKKNAQQPTLQRCDSTPAKALA